MNPVRGLNRKTINAILNKMIVCEGLLSITVRKSMISYL